MREAAQLLDLRAGLGHDCLVIRGARSALGWMSVAWLIGHAGVARAQDAGTAPEAAPVDEGPVDLTAPPPPPPAPVVEESWLNAPSERRCGFALGLQLGSILGTTRGYPNDALKIDRDEFLTKAGFSYGGQLGLYVGIALADWFVFGLGPSFGRLNASDSETRFTSLAFHIDAWPAFGAGGAWQDLGLTMDAGLGLLETADSHDTDVILIESGAGSRLALGVMWEGVRAWKLSMGPYAAADMLWSPSSLRPTASLGWRTTFYAGP